MVLKPRKPKSIGTGFEYRVVYFLQDRGVDAKRIPASGSSQGFKEDVISDKMLIQCKKTRGKKIISIRREDLDLVQMHAEEKALFPILVFSFQSSKIYSIIPLEELLKLFNNSGSDKHE